VTTSRARSAISSIAGFACLAAAAVAAGVICSPGGAAAADRRARTVAASVVRVPSVDRRALPEIAPGGTVVLRGSRPANSNATNTNPAPRATDQFGAGYGSSRPAAAVSRPGWDLDFDAGGLDTPLPPTGVIDGR